MELEVTAAGDTPVEVILPWIGSEKPVCSGDGLLESRVEPEGNGWRALARVKGRGTIRLGR